MKFLACLLVITVTIVHAADIATTIVPGGIVNDESNDNKSVEVESVTNNLNDALIGLVNNAFQNSTKDAEVVSNDEVPSTSIPIVFSDLTPQMTASTVSSFIQAVPRKKTVPTPSPTTVTQPPRKRLSTLTPLPTMTSPAALSSSHLLQGWIADEIADALWAFAPQPATNPKCTLQSQLYRNSINNFTMWAMQMLDSSNRIPSGILSGSVFQLGHFDQCVKISVPAEDLDGKYCLPTIKFAPTKDLHPNFHHDANPKFQEPDLYEPAYDYFLPNNDLSRRPRDQIHWAVCVPTSCTVEDIHLGLNEALVEPLARHGISINVSLPNEKCYARREEKPFPMGLYGTIGVLVLLYVTVIFATWMDMFYYQSGRSHSKSLRKWLKPFSAYTNISKLTTSNPDREFSEFHYLKAFAMTCVISGHRQMASHGPTPNENPWWLEWTYSQFMIAFSVNGGILVDTFFFLSGFLTCHYIYQELVKRKSLNLIVIVINRWIRIVPVYMFVIAIYAWVLPWTGDGPLWSSRIGLESSRCAKYWWTNILFINNYVNSEDQCMVQAWYLACDMHFFIIGALLVYAAWKWPKAGEILLWFTLFLSCAIPAYVTYINRYWGVVLHYNSLFIDPVSTEQFRTIYMTSHNRFGPYMVGILGAHILRKLKEKNFKFSIPTMIIGSIGGATLSVGALMTGYFFYIRERPYSLVESVLYAGTHRTIWSIGIMFFIVADATTGYGILYDFLKHPFFTTFGRLTYCAYLVHMIPQLIHTSSSRLPLYLDFKRMFWYTMGDFVMTYLLAFGLNLLFEAPLERLQKKILKKLLAKHDSKDKLRHERKFNGELTEVGVDNPALDKAEIA